ncbi:MAG: GGDEF domain-containing protein, partial [Oscillospiraceae bacterium]|nr:GGDEF domain-containing protein [Oscillospiraceae bacterium]
CMQSLFTSSRSIQDLSTAFTAEASFLHSPDSHFPPFDPASSESAGIFTPEGSPDNREHLLSYFLVIEVDAIRKSMESLRYLARHDQLTGLYNRHMMAEIVNDDPSIVIILDIDNFKGINDTYGHTAGDEALCTMSSRLEAVFWQPDRDLVFRLGGDEFLVVMRGASEEEAVSCLRLICEPVVFTTSDGQVISFSVSAGYIPCNGDFKASMKAADDALYAAKKAGKSGFVRAE